MTKNQKRNRKIRRWSRQAESRRNRASLKNYEECGSATLSLTKSPAFNLTYYQNMTVRALKAEAKERGLSGYSKMRKQQIIDLIVSSR